MAFKMTAAESKEFQQIVAELSTTYGDLFQAVDNFNTAVEKAKVFRDQLVERWQSEFDEKSEGWQGGEKGSEVESLISEWEDFDFPDDVDLPDDPSDDFSDLRLDAN